MRKKIDGDLCHKMLLENTKPALSFSEERDFSVWKTETYEKLCELIGIDSIKKNSCPLNLDVEEVEECNGYTKTRFTFESERGAVVPCYLLVPDTGKISYPVAIILQGHTGGFHHSIGEIKSERDKRFQPRAANALQAVERGFAALAIEQRGMGERNSPLYPNPTVHACAINALTALNLGRTTIGERVWDVHKAIDALAHFKHLGLDLEKIMLLGHSGGGTATYYAACFDDRIAYCTPGGAFCSYKSSIMSIHHCVCNYIPDICNWFEMEDLSALIAPRRMTVLTGAADEIFPIDGVRESFATVKKIYEKAGASDNCRLVVSDEAHTWSTDVFWNAIIEDIEKMGWNKGISQ